MVTNCDARLAPASAWLDMTRYPKLPPDEAVPGQLLAALQAILRAVEPPTVAGGAWQAAVDGAVTAVQVPDPGGW